MRLRIRTIKPDFFQHEGLFDAEQETGLPLRLAFEGLWCAADREGRFQWRVRALKANILPYDDVDFARVLDALWTRGFLVRYASADGSEYGWIPTFKRHQVINNREAASKLPEPTQETVIPCNPSTSTRDPRVEDACPTPLSPAQAEGKGMEGNGKGTATALVERSLDGSESLGTSVTKARQTRPRRHEEIREHLAKVLDEVGTGRQERLRADEMRTLQAELVFAYWQKKMGHEKALLDDKRLNRLKNCLKENRGDIHELLYAVDGWARDPTFRSLKEKDDRVLDGIENIYTTRERIERLAGHCKGHRDGKPHPMAVKYLEPLTGESDGGA